MILDINRPQYVSVPEALISSLAWKMFEQDSSDKSDVAPASPKLSGLMFRVLSPRASAVVVRETCPTGESLTAYGKQLMASGVGTAAGNEDLLAEAVLSSVSGVLAERSVSQAASPISPAFALLQNMRGVQRTQSPPDLAGILESLFELGSRSTSRSSVGEYWLRAADHRLRVDPLVAALDEATMASLLGRVVRRSDAPDGALPARASSASFKSSPFDWFARTWVKLTSDQWVEALPARVWVDWATTVLRLALGQSFLWESLWFDQLARRILRNEPCSWQDLQASMPEVLPWKSSRSSVGVRDVASLLKWRIHRGAAVRSILSVWLKTNSSIDLDFEVALTTMCGDAALRSELTSALSSTDEVAKNIWEAVRYSLLIRESAGPFADYYGLLRASGRYLTVEPETEWVAVVASLSAPAPGETLDVATLMSDLADLGLNPELGDLITLLERAGLARGSADADHGVQIQSAF
jgi:hypothetical protein